MINGISVLATPTSGFDRFKKIINDVAGSEIEVVKMDSPIAVDNILNVALVSLPADAIAATTAYYLFKKYADADVTSQQMEEEVDVAAERYISRVSKIVENKESYKVIGPENFESGVNEVLSAINPALSYTATQPGPQTEPSTNEESSRYGDFQAEDQGARFATIMEFIQQDDVASVQAATDLYIQLF